MTIRVSLFVAFTLGCASTGRAQDLVRVPAATYEVLDQITTLKVQVSVSEFLLGAAEVTVLEVDAVRKSFGGVVALHDVSMSVPRGQLFSVIGPNGAGKSTLFDIITGLTQPESGAIRYLAEDITRLRPDQRARS